MHRDPTRSRSAYDRPLLIVTMSVILAITLWPLGETNMPGSGPCVLCGARGLADALLNVAMFLPLGLLLARVGGPVAGIVIAVVFSGAIEAAQLAVPGRYASPADVLFNGIGAAMGVLLWMARGWLLERTGHRRDILGTGAAVVAGAVLFLTGWMLVPALPPAPYYAAWEPSRAGAIEYDGTVLAAAVGPFQARPGPLAYSAQMTRLLQQGAPVGVAATVADPQDGTAPLLAIFDNDAEDVVMLGIDGRDAVFRERMRATHFRLVTPELRIPDAFAAAAPGDTLQLASFRGRDGRCIDAQGTRTCGLEFTPGSGWQLLSGMRPESQGGGVLLNAAWLAILLLPVGFLARPRTALVLLLAMIWYIAIRLPVDTILAAAPWPEIVGSVAGVAAGLAIRRLVAPRSGPPAAPAVEETVAI